MSIPEIIGVITGLLCVWLTVRQNIWCWPVGIVSCVAFAILFWQIKLYIDMGLQFFFIVVSLQAWSLWLHGGPNHSRLPVTQLTSAQKVWLGIAVVLCVLTLGTIFDRYTDASLPFLDALASGASVPAQILLMRKKLESWYMWFVIDVLYVGIYIYKEVYLTAGLYVLFLGLAVAGLIEWKKTLNAPAPASATA